MVDNVTFKINSWGDFLDKLSDDPTLLEGGNIQIAYEGKAVVLNQKEGRSELKEINDKVEDLFSFAQTELDNGRIVPGLEKKVEGLKNLIKHLKGELVPKKSSKIKNLLKGTRFYPNRLEKTVGDLETQLQRAQGLEKQQVMMTSSSVLHGIKTKIDEKSQAIEGATGQLSSLKEELESKRDEINGKLASLTSSESGNIQDRLRTVTDRRKQIVSDYVKAVKNNDLPYTKINDNSTVGELKQHYQNIMNKEVSPQIAMRGKLYAGVEQEFIAKDKKTATGNLEKFIKEFDKLDGEENSIRATMKQRTEYEMLSQHQVKLNTVIAEMSSALDQLNVGQEKALSQIEHAANITIQYENMEEPEETVSEFFEENLQKLNEDLQSLDEFELSGIEDLMNRGNALR